RRIHVQTTHADHVQIHVRSGRSRNDHDRGSRARSRSRIEEHHRRKENKKTDRTERHKGTGSKNTDNSHMPSMVPGRLGAAACRPGAPDRRLRSAASAAVEHSSARFPLLDQSTPTPLTIDPLSHTAAVTGSYSSGPRRSLSPSHPEHADH